MELHDYIIDTPNRYITRVGSNYRMVDIHAYRCIEVPSTVSNADELVGTESVITTVGSTLRQIFNWIVRHLRMMIDKFKEWLGNIKRFFRKLIDKIIGIVKAKKKGSINLTEEEFKAGIAKIDAWLNDVEIEFIPHEHMLTLKNLPSTSLNFITEIVNDPAKLSYYVSILTDNKKTAEHLLDLAKVDSTFTNYLTDTARDHVVPSVPIKVAFKDLFDKAGLSRMTTWTVKDFDKVYATLVKVFTEERDRMETLYQPILNELIDFTESKAKPIRNRFMQHDRSGMYPNTNIPVAVDIIQTAIRTQVLAAVLIFRNTSTVTQACNHIFDQFETHLGLSSADRLAEIIPTWFNDALKKIRPIGTLNKEKISYYSLGDLIHALETSKYANGIHTRNLITELRGSINDLNAMVVYKSSVGLHIGLADEFLQKCPKDLIEVAVAHEIGHLRDLDPIKYQLIAEKMNILGSEYNTKGTQTVGKIRKNLIIGREITADIKAAQLYGEDKVIALLEWVKTNDSTLTDLERTQLDLRIAELEKAKNRKP